jgi:mRNA-degrading endonuclease RelE of RelBE toxin-antitoxin system
VTCQVFLSEHAQRDLEELPLKIVRQILADCGRLGEDRLPDGKRIKKLQGFKEKLFRLRADDYRIIFTRAGNRIDIVRVLSKPDFQKAY